MSIISKKKIDLWKWMIYARIATDETKMDAFPIRTLK